MALHKAVFLDKDGTLVDDSFFPFILPSDTLLVDDILDGLRYLQQKGYKLIIVSNQSWVAKGRMTKDKVIAIFQSVCAKLQQHGITIDGYYFCSHRSSDGCSCHKPKPGMLLQAAEEHNLDLLQSYIIGDRYDDLAAGNNVGVKTILVQTGCGKDYNHDLKPDYSIKNVNAVKDIL